MVERNALEDEVEVLQYGESEEDEFYRLNFLPAIPSFMDFWPTVEEPDNLYKYASVWIELSPHEHKTERETYSILEWLGDVGGLFDMLKLMGSMLVVPFATFRLKSELLSKIFRFVSSLAKAKSDGKFESTPEMVAAKAKGWWHPSYIRLCLEESIQWDFSQPKLIRRRGFCLGFICSKRYRTLMNKAEKQVSDELDLVKFLQRQRVTMYSLLALLSTRQQFMVDKMATMVLRESSDENRKDYGDLDLAQENLADALEHGKRSISSSNSVDQRLISFYRLKRWHEDRKKRKAQSV